MKISIILLLITIINISSSAPALDYTCGDKYCGPSYCETLISDKPRCQLTNTPIDWAAKIKDVKCQQCTQSTNAKCNGATIAAAIAGRTGIKAAYCTDTHLVFTTDGTTGNTPNLDDINSAPKGIINGVECVTGMSTLTEEVQTYKIPIDVTELSTASSSNNLAAFPGGGNDVTGGYIVNIKDSSKSYGLPVASGTGVTISGQNLFPIFSNVGVHCPQQCEVDRCNNHVGQGGGQPHQHGSGFGTNCMYDAQDYESVDSHPPQTGWSLDGYNIYGRYLSTSAPGYSTTLDDCGGHNHGTYGYHYHEQVFDYTTEEPISKGGTLGETIVGTTNGPKYCYKGDISKDALHWSMDKEVILPCCGMSEFYLATGMSWNFNVGTPSCGSQNCPSSRLGGTRSAGSSITYNLLAILLLGLGLVW